MYDGDSREKLLEAYSSEVSLLLYMYMQCAGVTKCSTLVQIAVARGIYLYVSARG